MLLKSLGVFFPEGICDFFFFLVEGEWNMTRYFSEKGNPRTVWKRDGGRVMGAVVDRGGDQ